MLWNCVPCPWRQSSLTTLFSRRLFRLGLAVMVLGSLIMAGPTGWISFAASWQAYSLMLSAPVVQGNSPVATVSAASYAKDAAVAPESIVAGFGTGLATRLEVATTQPLPTTLAGTTVRVNGEAAPLFFVSPLQINYLIPAGTPAGAASVTVTASDGKVSTGTVQIAQAAPALFAANSTGSGPLAAQLLRVKANNQQIYEPLAQYDGTKFITKPFDLGAESDQLFLVLYLTGVRQAATSSVRVSIGGVEYAPLFVGPVGSLVGLDQINVALPRSFGGRGRIQLLVKAAGAAGSNSGEFEIGLSAAASAAPVQITSLSGSPVLVGEGLEISGSGFAANPRENTVQVVADDGVTTKADLLSVSSDRLRIRVPFGAGTGQIKVSRGQSEASLAIAVRTSVSGFIEESKAQPDGSQKPVPIPGARVRLYNQPATEQAVNADGSFVIPDPPVGLAFVEVVLPAGGGLPFPNPIYKQEVKAGRDNQLPRSAELARIGGAASPGSDGAEAAERSSVLTEGFTLTYFPAGRTPFNLPVGHFSTRIAQITPFRTQITPATKLSLPNADAIPAGAAATLFKFDQTVGSATLGQFIGIGEAKVSADGQTVETAANAITEGSYYFVSIARPLAAINGRVVETDGRPVPRAIVQVRGQSTFTDGFGGFVLRNVPVIKASGDRVKVEVSYQRPDGSISRRAGTDVELSAGALVTVTPEIVLDAVTSNLPPVILAPSVLTLSAGETRSFDLIAFDPDSTQALQLTPSGTATAFTILSSQGQGIYRLQMNPAANGAGSYSLTLTATDSANASVTQSIAVTVSQSDPGKPAAQSQSITTPEDTSKAITLTGSDPGGKALSYAIVTPPSRGTLSGSASNLSYSPARDFNGNDSFTFKVSNGTTESQPAVVNIAVSPVNDPPVLNVPSAEQIVNAGETLNLVVTATDVDGDRLQFTATGLPPGAVLAETGGNSRVLNWTPTLSTTGTYTVSLTVSDNGSPALSDRQTIRLTGAAKWAKTSGPGKGAIKTVVALGAILFASTSDDGIYQSANDGQVWLPVNTGLPKGAVISLSVARERLFASIDRNGLFRLSNNGQSWQLVGSGVLQNSSVLSVVSMGDALFAGTTQNGVYRSLDNGQSWAAVNTGLPADSFVQKLFINQDTLYASISSNGIYKSVDNGQSWVSASSGLPEKAVVQSLAAIEKKLFASVIGYGIFLSDNQGQTWVPVNSSLPMTSGVIPGQILTINGSGFSNDPQGNIVRCAGVNAPVVLATSNRLDVLIPFGIVSGKISVRTAQGEGTSSTGLLANTSLSGFITDTRFNPIEGVRVRIVGTSLSTTSLANGSFTLQNLQPGLLFLLIEIASPSLDNSLPFPSLIIKVIITANNNNLLSDRTVIYLTGTFIGLVADRTDDKLFSSTKSLAPQVNPPLIDNFNVQEVNLYANDNYLLAGVDGTGVFTSLDKGQSWIPLNSNLSSQIRSVTISNGKFLAGDIGGKVFLLRVTSQSWVEASSGLDNKFTNTIAVAGSSLFTGTLGSGIFRSTDQGQNWNAANAGLPVNANLQSLASNGTTLFAAAFGDGVYRSTDLGANWSAVNSGLSNKFANKLFLVGSTLYAGTDGGVFRSTNGGTNWSAVNAGLISQRVVSFTLNNGALYAGTDGGGVFRLNADGSGWTQKNSGLTSQMVTALGVNNGVLYAGTSGGGICISRDGGENWTAVNNQIPSNLNVFAFAVSGKKVYAGSVYGVFVTEDEGQTWKQINAGLLNTFVTGLAISGDQLFASTASGGVFVSRIPQQ